MFSLKKLGEAAVQVTSDTVKATVGAIGYAAKATGDAGKALVSGARNLLPKKPVKFATPQELLDHLEKMQKQYLNRERMAQAGIAIGVVAAMAGMAADMMFLGGAGTITVVACLYADFRNGQQVKLISKELAKLDDKIDTLRAEMKDEPNFTPALKLLKSTVADFEAAAKREGTPVEKDLAALRLQLDALEEKLQAPANDEGAQAPKKQGGSAPSP